MAALATPSAASRTLRGRLLPRDFSFASGTANRIAYRPADEVRTINLGVTRTEQRLALADDFYLFDTPGMLWPRIVVPQSGVHLAASGAVGRNAYDDEVVALELLDILKVSYPGLLAARYALGLSAEAWSTTEAEVLLEAIGRQRGALVSGGRVDAQKAAELVIADFRATLLGRITLETPEQFQHWLAAGQAADAERARQKLARTPERARKPRKR